MAESGNIILDQVHEDFWPVYVLEEEATWYRWEKDLDKITGGWDKAKPIIEAFNRLAEWAEDRQNLTWLADFMINGMPLGR